MIEAAVAPKLARQVLPAKRARGEDLLGAFDVEFGGGVSPAGRPPTPARPLDGQPAVPQEQLQSQRRGTGRALGRERAVADSRLLEIARHKVVSAAKRAGISLKQTYAQEGKTLRRKAGGYAHAKQFKRLRQTVKRQRTILGVVMREVQRKLDAVHPAC